MSLTYNYTGKTVSLSTGFVPKKATDIDGKIHVENDSAVASTALTVVVTIPTGLTLVPLSANPSIGTFDDGTLTWTIPDPGIPANTTATLDLSFTIDNDSVYGLEVTYVAALDSGLETNLADNSGGSILCGIPCDDVKPCLNIKEYLQFGGNILEISGSGTLADPLLINAASSGGPSLEANNLITAGGDGGSYLSAQQIHDGLEALTPAPVLGSF